MAKTAVIKLSQDGRVLQCAGEWTLSGIISLPANFAGILARCSRELRIDVSAIIAMDTAGAFRLQQLTAAAEAIDKQPSMTGLKPEYMAIFDLINTTLSHNPPQAVLPAPSLGVLELLGRWAVYKCHHCRDLLAFIGEIFVQFSKMRRRGFANLWQTILKVIQTAGCEALPIVGVMSFLIGVVLAYQLGMQLQVYGADIYVVDASGIAILREFAPLMTAILIAGRTSTAFAALIGAMKVNEELDALTTMGISPIERIVLPRIIALVAVLPLLAVWSCLFSVLGSMVMVKIQMSIGYDAFLQRFVENVALKQYVLGLVKTPVFALVIAIVGCFQGFRVGVTADSVGIKTTAAAVQAIFLIIVVDAIFSMLFGWRGL